MENEEKPKLLNYLQVFLYFQAVAKLLLICLVDWYIYAFSNILNPEIERE